VLKSLQTAIMTRYNSVAGATLRALVQGMYEDLAPADVVLGIQEGQELAKSTLPFITFSIISTGLAQNFCADLYSPLVQFTVFGDGDNKSSIGLLNINRELLDLYNGKLLPMDDGFTMIRTDLTGQRKLLDDNKFWQIISEFTYTVQVDVTRETIV